MSNIRTKLISIIARNSDNPEKTVDEIMGVFGHKKQVLEEDYLESCNEGVEPCPTCGDIDGSVNPCCIGYDPLHFKNCGYG